MGLTELALITPEEFATAMRDRWHSLDNVSSPKLEQLWRTMGETFNLAAINSTKLGSKWRVLEPPTGSGKTQGLSLYAALTVQRNRTASTPLGMLIVTRTIPQANEIVSTIRELAALLIMTRAFAPITRRARSAWQRCAVPTFLSFAMPRTLVPWRG